MIIKCFLLLTVLYQISAFKYSHETVSDLNSAGHSGYEYSYPTKTKYRIITNSGFKTPSITSQQATAYGRPSVSATSVTRNFIARGKYPVSLQTCGPAPEKKIPLVTSHIRAPVQEKPTVRLQSKIPAPKTIAHSCTCYKTIVKPKVQQHLITVPTIQRYIETLHKPVIENIHYEAYPVKCFGSTHTESLGDKEKPLIQTVQIRPVEAQSIQTIQLSNEAPKTQIIEIPGIQFVGSQQAQKIGVPVEEKNLQMVKISLQQLLGSQKQEAIKTPQVLEEKKSENLGIPSTQFVESSKPQTIQLPRFEFIEAQKAPAMEIPRIQIKESPKLQAVGIPQGGTITLGTSPFTYQF